jgi:hypothetical protein
MLSRTRNALVSLAAATKASWTWRATTGPARCMCSSTLWMQGWLS